MAKIQRVVGTTSQILEVFVQNSSLSTGAGLTGLAFGTSGLSCYYKRNTASSSTAVTLATATVGTWATGGFKEVDATNMPGVYEFDPPNAALASGADSVVFYIFGAANMAPVVLEVELTAVNNQDAVRFGLSALPNGATRVKKNAAMANFPIYMVSSTDHVTPKTGLTITAQRSLDGAAFAGTANSATEVGLGWYVIALASTDTNADLILFEFSATGADATAFPVITQP